MDKKIVFTEVIKKNEGLIFKVAALYTDCAHDREDLYQEIVFQLWKSFDSFREQSKISTWMYRIAMNTAIYNLKVKKKQISTTSIESETDRFVDIVDKSDEERIKLLYSHIQKLNLLEKGITLLYLEGKSYNEISEIIGISASNVGTRISRIKEKLKTQIIKTK
ncbi:MAG: sigma-70 family RNA polymerase sigma factor [Pedobacter sp.]|nr:MAG: sigma-70 family RNA polymerase sigma factor [Pedobacter sp.]